MNEMTSREYWTERYRISKRIREKRFEGPYTAPIWEENDYTRAAREVLARRGINLSVASELASVFANVADALERKVGER